MTDRIPLKVVGESELTAFRERLTGDYGLKLLHETETGVLAVLPVGTGKSRWLGEVAVAALQGGEYDVVVVLAPRRDILGELAGRLSAVVSPFIFRPRPRQRCGALDAAWAEMEQLGCGALAREDLCSGCPRRQGCFWPRQHADLKGAKLVLATQQHLAVNPALVGDIARRTGAKRLLLLVDESDLLLRPADRTVTADAQQQFVEAQRAISPAIASRRYAVEWLHLSEVWAAASTSDLRSGRWAFPPIESAWAVAVQRAGRKLFGTGFRFLGYEAAAFARSDAASRERSSDGLRFAVVPDLGHKFMVFSGSVAPELVRYRLDPDHRREPPLSPFTELKVEHPGTRWYNLRANLGAAKFFASNAPQVLDFFAEKIADNIRNGRRTLLISRKQFAGMCANHLRRRLGQLDVGPVRLVLKNWKKADLVDPRTLPLITYGISGVNLFENHDAAYCLNSFYTAAEAVTAAVNDLNPTNSRSIVTLGWAGDPPVHVADVGPDAAGSILPALAGWVLDQKEADVAMQAVGRVRPFTRPREVITFQRGRLPGVRYDLEFTTLAQARSFFGIAPRRQADRERKAETARRLRRKGLTIVAVAEAVGVSLSTAKRYLRGS